jgi:hypothetical protein
MESALKSGELTADGRLVVEAHRVPVLHDLVSFLYWSLTFSPSLFSLTYVRTYLLDTI